MAIDPAPSSPTDTYISARDRAAAEVCALKDGDARDRAQTHAIAKLGSLLPVPAWHGPGWQTKNEYSVTSLCAGDIDFGRLDGRVYHERGTTVTVTSMPILKRWLFDHRAWWGKGKENIPPSIPVAFRTEAFFTQAISNDAAANLHGMVLVTVPRGADLAIVHLNLFAQDVVMDAGPDTLLAVVLHGDQVLIAQTKLDAETKPNPVCVVALHQARAKVEELLATYRASNLTDKRSFDLSTVLEDRADRDYRTCFAQHLREQPNYAAIAKQAQTLVDLLH